MDNHEFFMEASKNPDIKARKRTVKNLRKLGVDRAHEVDNKKREIDKLTEKYEDGDIDFQTYYDKRTKLEGDNYRSLSGRGVDIKVKDSYGNRHNVRFKSEEDDDFYNDTNDEINISPETFNSNKFRSSFNHEAGHVEQQKRLGLVSDNHDPKDYDIRIDDDYAITCAKVFLRKNHNKMNSHDMNWTELHADYLSAKKCGFGPMIKDIHNFKLNKEEIEKLIKDLIEENKESIKFYEDKFIRNNKGHVLSQADVDKCIALCNKAREKNKKYQDTLSKRLKSLKSSLSSGTLDPKKQKKLKSLISKIRDRIYDLGEEYHELSSNISYNGITAENAMDYKKKIKKCIDLFDEELEDLKREFTSYDYRIKFLEDMKHIHDGHPERCSMKYPHMTPADKKYMQEFTVEEMYLSKIITESEYVQLQERIQILTERSE